MRFDVITLFPELFGPFLASGVTRRAYGTGLVDVRLWNPRDYAQGNYRRVDDRPFGGGPGMVMMAPPLLRCLDAVRADRRDAAGHEAPVVLFSPMGKPLNHGAVERWSASQGAVLLCGRYEGVDPNAKTLLIGSHIDSVRDAGRYDGPLGIMLGIGPVELIDQAHGKRDERNHHRRLPGPVTVRHLHRTARRPSWRERFALCSWRLHVKGMKACQGRPTLFIRPHV